MSSARGFDEWPEVLHGDEESRDDGCSAYRPALHLSKRASDLGGDNSRESIKIETDLHGRIDANCMALMGRRKEGIVPSI
jgi:hypothetical protein